MSFADSHDDVEATEPFATPRIPNHDDFEDTQSFERPIADPDVPTFAVRAGLGDPLGRMPRKATGTGH
ncbi:MAG: hypothetical protein Q9161_005467 [Pseudevernia consocians]